MDKAERRRFGAVLALILGVFLALTLLPIAITGPLGRTVGPTLKSMLGVGAIGVPLLGILIGLAGFDRFERLDMKRVAILVVAGSILVPYVLGVLVRISSDMYNEPSWAAVLTGVIPGYFAYTALGAIGMAGALLVGFAILTGVTLATLKWHPLQRFEGGQRGPEPVTTTRPVRVVTPVIEDEYDDADMEEAVEPPLRRAARAIRTLATSAVAPSRADDDALPPLDLLDLSTHATGDADEAELQRLGELLLTTLKTFKVEGTLAGITSGPTVSQFEVVPAAGVKAGRIVALADDLAITMRATSLRVAPIPGRGAVGVEIASPNPRMVTLRELIASEAWRNTTAVLPIALGRDVQGRPVIGDLAKMPHLLVAGATGSGKSVAINTIITALIYRYTPRELRLLMVDPKMVELSMYNDLPHLRHKVVTDNSDAAQVLKYAVFEMNRRYALLHANGARQLADFNRKVRDGKPLRNPPEGRPTITTVSRELADTPLGAPWNEEYTEGELPMIVLIVDELADLMMTVQSEVETPLAMLAQKARAIGIHLILATQRPSVNVLTGLIKANFPSRIAFRVASKVDSRTILDQNGAEALLGNGDMLFLPPGRNEPQRIQGAYISTEETERVMKWYADRRDGLLPAAADEPDILELVRTHASDAAEAASSDEGARDALFRQAAETCIQHQGGSTSLLQRRLGVGYGRAARIIDQLHDAGILGPPNGSKPRDVAIGLHQLDEYL